MRRARSRPDGMLPPFSFTDLMQRVKSYTAKMYLRGLKKGHWPYFSDTLWQRNYYESIVWTPASFGRVKRYIENNPRSWARDKWSK